MIDPSDKMVRAWARIIAFNFDIATLDELGHAVAHFKHLAALRDGDLGSLDSICLNSIRAELDRRNAA